MLLKLHGQKRPVVLGLKVQLLQLTNVGFPLKVRQPEGLMLPTFS